MTKSIADILNAAADLIEPEGAWTQHTFRDRDCYCVLGALAEVVGVNPEAPWSGHEGGEARTWLAEAIQRPTYEVTDWNDAPERTQAEVVAKLREAAKLAGEQEK